MRVRSSVVLPLAGLLLISSLAIGATCGGAKSNPTPTPDLSGTVPSTTSTAAGGGSPGARSTTASVSSPSPSASTAAGQPTTAAVTSTPRPATAAATAPPPTATTPPTVAPTATPTLPPSPPPTATTAPFAITGVSYPASVQSGGAKGSLTVSWSGAPRFPVTMVYQMYSCPPNANCTNPSKTFASSANPLVFPEAVWCAGFTSTVVFGYEVVLTDADGKKTNAFKAPFTCTP